MSLPAMGSGAEVAPGDGERVAWGRGTLSLLEDLEPIFPTLGGPLIQRSPELEILPSLFPSCVVTALSIDVAELPVSSC